MKDLFGMYVGYSDVFTTDDDSVWNSYVKMCILWIDTFRTKYFECYANDIENGVADC